MEGYGHMHSEGKHIVKSNRHNKAQQDDRLAASYETESATAAMKKRSKRTPFDDDRYLIESIERDVQNVILV